MQIHPHGHRAAALARFILPVALVAAALPASAQQLCKGKNRTECVDLRMDNSVNHTFYLSNITALNDANEVLVALRNIMDPSVKLYFLASQNAIVMRALPDEIDEAQKIIDSVTRPRKAYRLTFTIATFDGNKRVSADRYDINAVAGERNTMKQGSKVPVVTGSYKQDSGTESQYTYLDIGANVDETLIDTGKGLLLKAKIERSSVGDEKAGNGILDPVVHQSVIEGFASLTLGKPTELGRADIAGTTQHIEVEVTAEPLS